MAIESLQSRAHVNAVVSMAPQSDKRAPACSGDALSAIFSHLPLPTVFHCREVCAEWRRVVDG